MLHHGMQEICGVFVVCVNERRCGRRRVVWPCTAPYLENWFRRGRSAGPSVPHILTSDSDGGAAQRNESDLKPQVSSCGTRNALLHGASSHVPTNLPDLWEKGRYMTVLGGTFFSAVFCRDE